MATMKKISFLRQAIPKALKKEVLSYFTSSKFVTPEIRMKKTVTVASDTLYSAENPKFKSKKPARNGEQTQAVLLRVRKSPRVRPIETCFENLSTNISRVKNVALFNTK